MYAVSANCNTCEAMDPKLGYDSSKSTSMKPGDVLIPMYSTIGANYTGESIKDKVCIGDQICVKFQTFFEVQEDNERWGFDVPKSA